MTQYLNIDKSAFRRGEYVGYADGVWRIKRRGSAGWEADRQVRDGHMNYQRAETLGAMSRKLEEYAALHTS